jgi:hypothetical protein
MTTKAVKAAFRFDGFVVKLDQLRPTKKMKPSLRETPKYKAIVASIREVGVIEPLIVHPDTDGTYLLLDGHARLEALRAIGKDDAFCLAATDDETYTYNHQVNRVAPIQANRMILKALDAGVAQNRLANALALSVDTIRRSRNLLAGICPEAIEMLKDKAVAQETFRYIKKVKPIRQIEMAELMTASGTYSTSFAKALFVATPKEQLVEPDQAKKRPTLKPEDLARMEHEMQTVQKDFILIEESYGRNVVDLTLARGYLKKLLDNSRVVRYLAQKHRELLPELQRIVEAAALES